MRTFLDAAAQSTCSSAITSGQSTVVLQSTTAFGAPSANAPTSAIILDSGNPNYSAASPLATPYEYASVTANNTGTNTLTWTRGQAGTTAKAFFAGATVAAVLLAEDLNASFTTQLAVANPSGAASVSFTSIPGTYSTLSMDGQLQTNQAGAQSLFMTFNSDSSAVYEWTTLFVVASTGVPPSGASAGSDSKVVIGYAGVKAYSFSIWIPNYASTTLSKGAMGIGHRFDGSGTDLGSVTASGIWNPAVLAAITTITLTPAAGTLTGKVVLRGHP